MTDQIVTTLKDGILQIRINRPEKKNALTQDMYAAMAAALSQADENAAVRVVALTGTGDSFTSGNDVADFLKRDDSSSDGRPVGAFLAAIAGTKKPLIAGVNGMAIGVGVTMLLPFTNLGVVPEAASSQLLPLMLGYRLAAELMLLGERIDARRAFDIGLINAVAPASELPALVAARAAAIAAKPASSILATKALLRRAPEPTLARMSLENAEFARLLQSPEARAIMQAFLDRRRA
jgi:enoyl-CoA hydratase/carnithine racemase